MNNNDKQRALIELGNASMNALQKAHADMKGLALVASVVTIRTLYATSAAAIINSKESSVYELGQKPTEIITINKESE